jgi:hypothetical protein
MTNVPKRRRLPGEHPAAAENLDIDLPPAEEEGKKGREEEGENGNPISASPRSSIAASIDFSGGHALAVDDGHVAVRLPLADPPDTQAVRVSAWHVDVQLRDAATRRAFMRVWAGLDRAGARLKDGRRVISYADALRWLLEQVEAIDRAERPETYDARHNPTFPGK